MELFSITTVLLGILTALVLFLWRKLTYWRTRGVPYATPILLSEKTRGIGKSLHMGRFQKELYDQFKGKSSAGGLIILTNPTLMIVDLDLVKNILIKDFHNFPNRNGYYNEVDDPLTAHLVNLEDDEWRSLRSKLTPTFTSGKLKMMFPTMVAIADNLNSTLEVEIANTKTVEIKEILSRFTIDVIGTIAFGLDCNSLSDKNAEFYRMGTKSFDNMNIVKRIIMSRNRSLARKLHLKVIPDEISDFYTTVVRDTINYREQNDVVRNDFMNLLIELKNSKADNALTLNQVAAQCFIFFLAGYETTSTTMQFCLYELSLNKEIQEKARRDVAAALKKHGGLTYEAVNDMKYLEQCIEESLRKWPPVPGVPRICVKDYLIPNTSITIEKGIPVLIPIYAIHHDKDIYENPEEFIPERFSPGERAKRHPLAFIPFGEGPRICIGMRFALVEAKIGLAKLLSSFEFILDTIKTPKLNLSPKKPILSNEGGIYMKIRKL